ncbi:hypothetical protein HK101_003920, partial [Irineochytrium annulatum]
MSQTLLLPAVSTATAPRRRLKPTPLSLSTLSIASPPRSATPVSDQAAVSDTDHYASGPARILPKLYLGDERVARDEATLRRLGVGHVVNVAGEVHNPLLSPTPSSSPSPLWPLHKQRKEGLPTYEHHGWSHTERDLPSKLRSLVAGIRERVEERGET